MLLARARALWAGGQGKAARSALSEAERAGTGSDQPLVTVHIRLTRLLAWRTGASDLADVAARVDGSFAAAAAAVARGAAAGEVETVVEGGERFAAIGARLEAAEVFALAASLAHRAGRPDRERSLVGRVHALTDAMGGVQTPTLRRVLPASPLTPRQRDVAVLVAEGLANRQVADKLGVGLRTVESHLEEVYRRLGLNGRGDLAVWFAEERSAHR
jgi:DNA-binding CsgD family transcriptional regulator